HTAGAVPSSMSFVIRPALASTLFPYTPLFRSRRRRRSQGVRRVCAFRHAARGPNARWVRGSATPSRSVCPARLRVRRDERGAVRDRKSTRLNSSHSQNSYAVFFLKKKKACDNP